MKTVIISTFWKNYRKAIENSLCSCDISMEFTLSKVEVVDMTESLNDNKWASFVVCNNLRNHFFIFIIKKHVYLQY